MRQFLVEFREVFLADGIRNRQFARIVRHDVLGEERLAFLGKREERVHDRRRAPVLRRDALDPDGGDFFRIPLDRRGGGLRLLPRIVIHCRIERLHVRLVQHEDDLLGAFLRHALHPADVLQLRGFRRVEDDAEDVHAGGAPPRHAVQERTERPDRLVEAGRVEKDELSARVGDDAAHGIACRLLDGRDDGDLLADEPVDERRLAGVRASDDPDYCDLCHHGTGKFATSSFASRFTRA